MTPANEESEPNSPPWLMASIGDFAATDINAPLSGASTIDCMKASTLYGSAASAEGEKQNGAGQRAFSMLGAVCSFHFKPAESAEPFSPMLRSGERRSAQPSDFKGTPVNILAGQVERILHMGVRARVADVVWLLDHKHAAAGIAAVTSYGEIVQAIIDRSASLRSADADEHGYEIPGFLRRALQIGKSIGWDKSPVIRVRQLVAALRETAVKKKEINSFLRLGAIDLDFQISAPPIIATEAELLVNEEKSHSTHSLLHCAARAYGRAKNQVGRDRCLLAAAEVLVTVADAQKGSAMGETHWLEQAIAEMRRIPSAKARWRDLKHRLVDAQSRILDEMTSFSHSEDIAEVVEDARKSVAGKPLPEGLRTFAVLSRAPTPEQLEAAARQAISENPLSSIFSSTRYDSGGKPVHRHPGGSLFADDGKAALQKEIAQSEKLRRSLIATGVIEPMRQTIMTEHSIDENTIAVICQHSIFVPPHRAAIFASGLLHFMQGDMIAALHTLAPQLENSLRHLLRLHGHDVIKLNDDMTQEDVGLTTMLTRLRPELEEILGPAMIADIENVFAYRGGPHIRDRVAHGLISQWEPFGEDAIYACWIIYHLCCIPLLPHWKDLGQLLR